MNEKAHTDIRKRDRLSLFVFIDAFGWELVNYVFEIADESR
jgi:hypothetical protein